MEGHILDQIGIRQFCIRGQYICQCDRGEENALGFITSLGVASLLLRTTSSPQMSSPPHLRTKERMQKPSASPAHRPRVSPERSSAEHRLRLFLTEWDGASSAWSVNNRVSVVTLSSRATQKYSNVDTLLKAIWKKSLFCTWLDFRSRGSATLRQLTNNAGIPRSNLPEKPNNIFALNTHTAEAFMFHGSLFAAAVRRNVWEYNTKHIDKQKH